MKRLKRLKSSKAYGAFEYLIVITLIILVAIIISQIVSGKARNTGTLLNKAIDKANTVIDQLESPEKPEDIVVLFLKEFEYDFENDFETSVSIYFANFVIIKDINNDIRTDYILKSVSRLEGFAQVIIELDGKTITKQFLVNETYSLATDSDFSGTTTGTFKYIGNAESVEIPDIIKGVTVTSYANMFEETTVKAVKSSNTNIINTHKMFYNSKAPIIYIGKLNTKNVTDMSYMFAYSKAITLDLSNLETENVNNMLAMFYCAEATNINLSNFETSKVINMGHMFYASRIKIPDLSSFDTQNVTNMYQMFTASQATSLDLRSFNTEKVTNMSYMFYVMYYIKDLNLTSFNTINVKNMSNMFGQTRIQILDLSSFNMSNVSDRDFMFMGAQITTGYARTWADATRLNGSNYKPTELTFIVKP